MIGSWVVSDLETYCDGLTCRAHLLFGSSGFYPGYSSYRCNFILSQNLFRRVQRMTRGTFCSTWQLRTTDSRWGLFSFIYKTKNQYTNMTGCMFCCWHFSPFVCSFMYLRSMRGPWSMFALYWKMNQEITRLLSWRSLSIRPWRKVSMGGGKNRTQKQELLSYKYTNLC